MYLLDNKFQGLSKIFHYLMWAKHCGQFKYKTFPVPSRRFLFEPRQKHMKIQYKFPYNKYSVSSLTLLLWKFSNSAKIEYSES